MIHLAKLLYQPEPPPSLGKTMTVALSLTWGKTGLNIIKSKTNIMKTKTVKKSPITKTGPPLKKADSFTRYLESVDT